VREGATGEKQKQEGVVRAIKFRAWDVFNEEMLQYANDDALLTSSFFRDVWKRREGGNTVHVMQFTGLLDKAGKEIYEGDVLATSNSDPEYDLWTTDENGYTVVCWNELGAEWRGSNWVWDSADCDESIYSLRFVEVIGNVHEHPELLK